MAGMKLVWLKVPQWEKEEGLLHGFMGRHGGKSVGPYAGLNVSYSVGDDPKIVSRNVCDMKLAVGIHDGRIVTVKQVHGDRLIEIKETNIKEAGEADGMVTREKNVFLGVLTADCVPMLFLARQQKNVAVVHAGWRGTLGGIAGKTVKLFFENYGVLPSELEVALGPAIDACCYAIGSDVARSLIEQWAELATSSIKIRDNKTYLHLRNLNQAILHRAGVPQAQIFQIGPCTSCAEDEFFSYRRDRKQTGRQISFIGWHF
jgi:polyphenol oxidase